MSFLAIQEDDKKTHTVEEVTAIRKHTKKIKY